MIFKKATASLPCRFADRIETGSTDAELEATLKDVLGIFGGSGGLNQPSIAHTGSGLRIWGAWHVINNVQEKPLFEGKATIAMARKVYNIPDPNNQQMKLL